jgi:hypothetical protein
MSTLTLRGPSADRDAPATLVRWKAPEEIEIVVPSPHPPGARLALWLDLPSAGAEATTDERHEVRMKSHGCKRLPDGRFHVVGRVLDLRRTAREALDRASIEPLSR